MLDIYFICESVMQSKPKKVDRRSAVDRKVTQLHLMLHLQVNVRMTDMFRFPNHDTGIVKKTNYYVLQWPSMVTNIGKR